MADIAALLVVSLVAANLTRSVFIRLTDPHERVKHRLFVQMWKAWMIPLGLAVVIAVALVAYLTLSLPVLGWSWWSALGGQGNPVLGRDTGSTTSFARHVFTITAVAMPFLFAIVVPREAHLEEDIFRRNDESRSPVRRVGALLGFGLAHALVGIPLGICLALGFINGSYYLACYYNGLRQGRRLFPDDPSTAQVIGTYRAAAAHATCNYIVLSVVVAASLIRWILT